MNWDHMNRYGTGIWAGSIRYAKQRFWIFFGTPDEGYFMTSAPTAAGPWTPVHPVLKSGGWDDCCSFWDDNGQGYFIGTHYADDCKTYLWKLTPDGRDIVPETRVQVNQGAHREANKLFKVNDWYYHLFSEVNGARRRDDATLEKHPRSFTPSGGSSPTRTVNGKSRTRAGSLIRRMDIGTSLHTTAAARGKAVAPASCR